MTELYRVVDEVDQDLPQAARVADDRVGHILVELVEQLELLDYGLLVTGGLFAAAFLNRMEYDMMKLEPAQMTSIKMYNKVLEKFDINIMSAMAVADSVEEARQLQEALEQESLIAEVSSVAQFIPSDEQQIARLDEIRWLLEELRVSLFAQELKTAQPVSAKRIRKRWEALGL